ncbi:MAG: choice-of-anchor tandem repeat GloVer-containing protein [Terriglobia bacterium]
MTTNKQEGTYPGFLRETLAGGWWKSFSILCLVCGAAVSALHSQTFTSLHSFDVTDGSRPTAPLVQGADGNFYGTTFEGGTCCGGLAGTVFKITSSGVFTSLHDFDTTDGYFISAGLVQGADGNFYGAAEEGGPSGDGTIFKITPGGVFSTFHAFSGSDGANPYAGLVLATDANFYGTTGGGGTDSGGTAFKITPGGTLTSYSFRYTDGGFQEGAAPGGLVQGADGNFYGVASAGGSYTSCPISGCGTVFKVAPDGTITRLYSFCSQGGAACTDGSDPEAPLVQGTDGNFYGTTAENGANDLEYGTVFRITPSGTLTTLYNFCSQGGMACTDGVSPRGALIQGPDENFYGTTYAGGANGAGGTIFKMTPSGMLTTLYSFCAQGGDACTDGSDPDAGLVLATDGNLYGTTEYGGASGCLPSLGCGTVFKLSLGQAPGVNLSPTSLTFGPQGAQAPNTPQVVTLTNTGQAPLFITSIAISGQNGGDFAQANNCPISPNSLAPGDYCSITVYFFPVGPGTLSADVTVTDNAPGSPQSVSLTGAGVSGKPGLAWPGPRY